MGIRGLKRYLTNKLDGVLSNGNIPRDSTLCIDGDGWIFMLIELCEKFRSELGGCYRNYASAISKEISFLSSYGIKMIVFFDGPNRQMKYQTTLERAKQQEEQWIKLYNYCENNFREDQSDGFPLPPLCKLQLIKTLKDLCVELVFCEGEADQEIAKFVSKNNLSSVIGQELYYAYGRDSDYIAFKDCAYIEFGSLIPTVPGKSVSCVVWRRTEICEALGITEEQFLDWVMLVGNDYTQHYFRDGDFNLVVDNDCVKRSDIDTLEKLLHLIKLNENVRLEASKSEYDGEDSLAVMNSTTDPHIFADREIDAIASDAVDEIELNSGFNNLGIVVNQRGIAKLTDDIETINTNAYRIKMEAVQLAIDFSRANYNLQPLDGFPLDPPDEAHGTFSAQSHCIGLDADGEEVISGLSAGMRKVGHLLHQRVEVYVQQLCGSSGGKKRNNKTSSRNISQHAIAFFQYLSSSSSNDDENSSYRTTIDTNTVTGRRNTEKQLLQLISLSDQQLQALDSMQQQLSNDTHHRNINNNVRPRWSNVLAGFIYQRACSILSKLLPQYIVVPFKKEEEDSNNTISKKISRSSKNNPNNNGRSGSDISYNYCDPKYCFDGVLFHNIISTMEAAAAAEVTTKDNMEVVDTNGCITTLDTVFSENNAIEQGQQAATDITSTTTAVVQEMSSIAIEIGEGGHHALLPIDAYREEILDRIRQDRVTIIHGETGCGKSSCLPRFILEEAEEMEAADLLLQSKQQQIRQRPMTRSQYQKQQQLQQNSKNHGDVAADVDGQRILVPLQKRKCNIFVSQPRRIAVTSLLRRLRQTLGSKVGMRMGHGIKDEYADTRITFVTTGYLVRLLAHHPDSFRNCTHLIIDEVHERSVDGDLVCLLAKQLLRTNPDIKVILMSATIHTDLYRTYFAEYNDGSYGNMDCLSVGARRFPVQIFHAEEILELSDSFANQMRFDSKQNVLSSMIFVAAREVLNQTKNSISSEAPSAKLIVAQYKLAVNLVRAIGVEGTGVLIFVSGINDITEIIQLFEPFQKFLLFPIHSDIPPEEQELAFGVTPSDKVKVVVATNAAESSITIPDIDVVVCLGTHKALQYSSRNHCTQLVNTWISKASATQRAGRTGRVRPGTVYRLYSSNMFASFSDHETAEVHRRPLEDVVLNMWVLLEDAVGFEGVTPFLQGLIEPPDMKNIVQSYQTLYEADLITHPSDDHGFLTSIGRLSGELPVDIKLGRMIAYGVMLGVAAEAVVLAAALSLPKSPFRHANPMYSDPEEYNTIVRTKFLTATEFDCGTYSEPIMLVRLLQHWHKLQENGRHYNAAGQWAMRHGLVAAGMKQFHSIANHLMHTVSSRLQHHIRGADANVASTLADNLNITTMSRRALSASTVNILRLILVWTSSGNVLYLQSSNTTRLTDVNVVVHSDDNISNQLSALYGPRVDYNYTMNGKRVYDSKLLYWNNNHQHQQSTKKSAKGANNNNSNLNANAFVYKDRVMEVLYGMQTVVIANAAAIVQCYWLVVQPVENFSSNNLIIFVIPNHNNANNKDDVSIVVQTVSLLLSQVFQENADRFNFSSEFASDVAAFEQQHNSSVLVVSAATKTELKRLNDFRDHVKVSLSMLIPSTGNAKLTAYNMLPDDESVRKLFQGKNSDSNDDAVVSEHKVACQISGQRAVISFPDEDELNFPASNNDNNSENDDDSAAAYDDINKSRVHKPLIDDLPLGHRLINCCQQQLGKTRQKHLSIAINRKETGIRNSVPVGSAAYAAMIQQQLSHHDDGDKDADGRMEVRLGCITANWVNVRSIKTTHVNNEDSSSTNTYVMNGDSIRAVLPKQSMLSCSFHRGPEAIFAVAHYTLLLGASASLVACEGVTMLPPGPAWLALALTCTAADPTVVMRYGARGITSSAVAAMSRGNTVPPTKQLLAEEVARLLREATKIIPRSDIITLIEEVFDEADNDDQYRHHHHTTTEAYQQRRNSNKNKISSNRTSSSFSSSAAVATKNSDSKDSSKRQSKNFTNEKVESNNYNSSNNVTKKKSATGTTSTNVAMKPIQVTKKNSGNKKKK